MSSLSVPKIALGGIAALGLAFAGVAVAQDYDSTASYSEQPTYDRPANGYADPSYGETRMGEVIVRAPRRAERDPATGATIDTVTATREVRYDDLDLNSRWGAHVLRVRIDRAAQDACEELEQRYTIVRPDDSTCVRRAVQEAVYQTPLGDDDDD